MTFAETSQSVVLQTHGLILPKYFLMLFSLWTSQTEEPEKSEGAHKWKKSECVTCKNGGAYSSFSSVAYNSWTECILICCC